MPINLTSSEKRRLRSAAHALKPVVMIGNNGYTDAVGEAINEALTTHELIKVRLRGIESEERDALGAQICEQYGAACVGIIGTILILFRPNPDEK